MTSNFSHPRTIDADIASAGTTSQVIAILHDTIVGLITPAALTSIAITFTGCDTATGTFQPIYDSDGNQVSLVVAANRAIGLSGAEADAMAPFPYIKVVCGSAEASARVISVLKK